MSDPFNEVRLKFARKSIKWRLALAWVVVAVLTLYYLVHPVANIALAYSGQPAMMPLPPLAWSDILALLGGPVAGAFADRVAGEE